MKGVAIAFLPFLLAGLIGVGIIGLAGTFFTFLSQGFAKVALISIGVLVAFMLYNKQRKGYPIKPWEYAMIVGIMFMLMAVILNFKLPLGESVIPVYESIIG